MPIYVISTIKQKGSAQFPIVEDSDLKGGFRVVADLPARNAIWTSLRSEGMRVHVISENTDYKLLAGLTNGDWDVIPDGAGFELLGMPTTGDWSGSFLGVDENTRKTDAIWLIDDILGKLAPPKPDDLSTKTLSMATYSALEAGTGTAHNCTDDTTPSASAADFGDGASGVLTAYIDTVDEGNATLSVGDDTGAYSALNITVDEDPYLGEPGKEGIYQQLGANITPVAPLSIGLHAYYMEHSATGATPSLDFYVDDPILTTLSSVVITLPGSNTKFVSGVPSLSATDNILFSCRVNDAVQTHYNAVRLGTISGANIVNTNLAPPVVPPTLGSAVDYISEPINPTGYAETLPVVITPYSSNDAAGTPYNDTLLSRVDLLSDESARVESGSGEFPAAGYGTLFDSTQSLKTVYTEELQMLNGKYQRPNGDYTGNLPTAGEDYDVGMGVADRWVTFQSAVLSNNSAFDLDLLAAEDFAAIETPGVKIYVKVEGETGWLDANTSYPGTGNPVADGDPAMVYGSSSATTKRVTFGSTVRSGNLFVRIAFPDGSIKKISGISISNII